MTTVLVIALAILLGLGPVFVVLALFRGTRGLFVGWLKGVVLLALAPLFAVLGGSIMLELAVPVLAALVAVPGQIDQQAAMAFFLVGFVHAALMLMALVVSAMMSMTNMPLVRASSLGPSPGLGNNLSSTLRVGPKRRPEMMPPRPTAMPDAMTGDIGELPKPTTYW